MALVEASSDTRSPSRARPPSPSTEVTTMATAPMVEQGPSSSGISRFIKRRRGQSTSRALEESSPAASPTNDNLLDASHGLQRPHGHARRQSKDMAGLGEKSDSSPESSLSPGRPTKGSRFTLRRAPSNTFSEANGRSADQALHDEDSWDVHTPRAESPAAAQIAARSPSKRQQLSAMGTGRLAESIAGGGGSTGDNFLRRFSSGWFSQVASSTSAAPPVPPLPTQAAPPAPASPRKGGASGDATRQGPRALAGLDRMLDKARVFFMDTDSNVDRCPDDIWLIGGIVHAGWRPADDAVGTSDPPSRSRKKARKLAKKPASSSGSSEQRTGKLRTVLGGKRTSQVNLDSLSPRMDEPSLASSSDTSLQRSASPPGSTSSSLASPPSPSRLSATSSYDTESTWSHQPPPSLSQTYGWPPLFYLDFASRIQLTYRSQFPPIPCAPTTGMANTFHQVMGSLTASIGRGGSLSSAEGLSSDAGWGCMLRTGQSLLANALASIHLGRDWRRTLPSVSTPDLTLPPPPAFATYVRLVSWFIDDPSPLCPFSVHRFALMGKQLGKQVGEWFGPSTAAGAIKALANDFTPAGLGVATAVDGTLYKSDVLVAAAAPEEPSAGWSRPVLILLNLRLGIDGVTPIYYESIKALFSLPQSVGIAGGRPSSSYYFVGSQADSLFYIDPHHTAPALPLRQPPLELRDAALTQPMRPSAGDDWQTIDFAPSASTSSEEALERFFGTLYTEAELRSFHCNRVRKMALSGLDPSMLVGLLCRDEADWNDLCERMRQIGKGSAPLVHIAERPPAWARSVSSSAVPTGSRKTSAASRQPSSARNSAVTAGGDVDEGFEASASDSGDEEASFNEPDDWDITTDEDLAAEEPVDITRPKPSIETFAEVAPPLPPKRTPSPSVLISSQQAQDAWEGVDGDGDRTASPPTTPRTAVL